MTSSPSIFQHSFVSQAARSWYFESPGERRAYKSYGLMHISLSLFLFPFLLLSACVFIAFSYSQSWAFTFFACSTESYHLHLTELTFLGYNQTRSYAYHCDRPFALFPSRLHSLITLRLRRFKARVPGEWRLTYCMILLVELKKSFIANSTGHVAQYLYAWSLDTEHLQLTFLIVCIFQSLSFHFCAPRDFWTTFLEQMEELSSPDMSQLS